ncbi:MAG: type ISP restriction/modification enzyme, partial [Pseudanabaenaceae cyanobacterium]
MRKAKIYYARMDEFWTKQQKLEYLESLKSFKDIKWESIEPDAKYNWLLEGLHSEYEDFLPLGTKEAKSTDGIAAFAIFKLYSGGVKTSRDAWAYNFNHDELINNICKTIKFYNGQVYQWQNREDKNIKVDDFIKLDDSNISWSDGLRIEVSNNSKLDFDKTRIRFSIYRPFTRSCLY